jgi:hypothetical protein
LKLLKENLGKTLGHIGIVNTFLNRTPITQEIRARIDKWYWIKLKSFYTEKEIITRMQRQPTEQKKIFASYLLDKGLISTIYKKLQKLNTKRTNNSINKWANESNVQFSKEEI